MIPKLLGIVSHVPLEKTFKNIIETSATCIINNYLQKWCNDLHIMSTSDHLRITLLSDTASKINTNKLRPYSCFFPEEKKNPYWSRCLQHWIRLTHTRHPDRTIIVTDVNLPHEINAVRKLGGYIIAPASIPFKGLYDLIITAEANHPAPIFTKEHLEKLPELQQLRKLKGINYSVMARVEKPREV